MEKALRQNGDFTSGKIFPKLIAFALPMALASILQLLFNAADIAVVGHFSGESSSLYQAAVGATTSSVHVIVNLFIGISSAVNVAMANAFGAKDQQRQKNVIHTSMTLSIISGLLVLIVGLFISAPLLRFIKTPLDIIDYSTTYMQIYFLGAPALMVYNFGAGLMRGVGESKKPLLYLFVSGILNIIINIICVVVFDLNVVGVALGTTLSQYFAAIWIVIDLVKGKYGVKLNLKELSIDKKELKYILFMGIPMGISSSCFSIANIIVQSAINGYGSTAIAGHTVSVSIYGIVDAVGASVQKAVMTFLGQNMGAKKPERFNKIIGAGVVANFIILSFYTIVMVLAGRYICMLFTSDTAVIDAAVRRIMVVDVTCSVLTLNYTYGGGLNGIGRSSWFMIIQILFVCVFRICWLLVMYPLLPNSVIPIPPIEIVYIVYPLSWLLTGVLSLVCYYLVSKKIRKQIEESFSKIPKNNND